MQSVQAHRRTTTRPAIAVEWQTLTLFVGCWCGWALALFGATQIHLWLAICALVPTLVLHASLSHEILHGHPFASHRANIALGLIQPGVFIPFIRFRDTHLAHHTDARLTDPYDDPESNYLDPDVWHRLPRALRTVLQFNNTLLGRVTLGPLLSQATFMARDARAIWRGEAGVLKAWLWHLPGVAFTLACVALAGLPIWAYLIACYLALSVLKIRTFAEHRAHAHSAARSVIIEDRGALAFLFLNNNLHLVHHMHPQVPWYALPALYRSQKQRYLSRNQGYRFATYGQLFRAYVLRTKDSVAHPLWSGPRD